MRVAPSIYAFPHGPRSRVPIPLVTTRVCAGFPSPADDYIDGVLDLNELCITHPAATVIVRASGVSMSGGLTDIHDGDWMIVNRAINPVHGHIVVACVDGEFCVKRVKYKNHMAWLASDNPESPLLLVNQESEVAIWGVVGWIFRKTT